MRVSTSARSALVAFVTFVLGLSLASPAQAVATLTVTPTATIGPVAVGSSPTASFTIAPNPAGATVHLAWTVRSGTSADDPVVRSGNANAIPDTGGVVSLTFDTPTELGEGTYGLEVVASDDVAGAGPASGTSGILPVLVDNPPVPHFQLDQSVIFPDPDTYLDLVNVVLRSSEPATYSLDVLTPGGQLVRNLAVGEIGSGRVYAKWRGYDAAQVRVPEGDYVIRASMTDSAGNQASAEGTVTVRWGFVRWLTKRIEVTPKASLSGKFVGRCSKLASPSSHR